MWVLEESGGIFEAFKGISVASMREWYRMPKRRIRRTVSISLRVLPYDVARAMEGAGSWRVLTT